MSLGELLPVTTEIQQTFQTAYNLRGKSELTKIKVWFKNVIFSELLRKKKSEGMWFEVSIGKKLVRPHVNQ
jgi:hypothetical protein